VKFFSPRPVTEISPATLFLLTKACPSTIDATMIANENKMGAKFDFSVVNFGDSIRNDFLKCTFSELISLTVRSF
jgi:hypothetical protein